MLTVDHQEFFSIRLTGEKNSRHGQPQQKRLDKPRGFGLIPHIAALKIGHSNIASIETPDSTFDIKIYAEGRNAVSHRCDFIFLRRIILHLIEVLSILDIHNSSLPFELHIPSIFPTHVIQRMADLPQAMRLHRLHQRLEHIASFPRSVLKIRQTMPVVDHRGLFVGVGLMRV